MSGLEVIGGIAAVISIIDASIKIYDSTQKDIKLSETFNTVRRRLPILLNTLEACKNYLEPIRDTMPQDVCQALEKILKACDEKARKLKEIFEKIIPNEKDTWEKRYFKVVQRFGKGNKVEDLMIAVTKDVQLIVNHHIVNSATPGQKAELEEIIKEMKSLPSSIPEDENLDMSFSAGRDMNAYVHRGPGDHHFASKGGRIYSASTQHFGGKD